MNESNGLVISAIIRPTRRIVATLLLGAGFYLCSAPGSAVPGTTMGSYLGSRYVSANVPCGSKNYTKEIGTVNENPEEWNSNWRPLREQASANGEILNQILYMDGVKKSSKFEECRNKAYGFRRVPLEYVHRTQTKNWICHSGSCAYVGSTTSKWSPGTAKK